MGRDLAALPAERRRRLLELVGSRGAVRVTELADELGVSASTVRRDLSGLHRQGRVVRVHGGAGSSTESVVLVEPSDARAAHLQAKRAIGRGAARLVEDGMTIMVLAGTTAAAMVPFLGARRGLTLVTNGLDIAHEVGHTNHDISVVVVGGVLQRPQMTMIGAIAEHTMQVLHVDVMFGGATGVDPVLGATGPKLIQGARRDLLRLADSLVVLADGSKLGRRGPARLAEPHQISRVLTDSSAPMEVVALLRGAGMHVDVCR